MKAFHLAVEQALLRYIEVPGQGPPLVWVHGLMCSSTGELLPTAVQEPLWGRRSLLVDLLGYGYSDRPVAFGYALEDHARTIVALLDGLAIQRCAVVGHSMGGAVAALVAAARPKIVSTLIVAEPALGDPLSESEFAEQSEDEFATEGFAELLRSQQNDAEQQPAGFRAAHLGITRMVAPRALYRGAASLARGTSPTVRLLLKDLPMPRYYLQGEATPGGPQEDLVRAGVEWRTVPMSGHPMGLQNPFGFAVAVADAIRTT